MSCVKTIYAPQVIEITKSFIIFCLCCLSFAATGKTLTSETTQRHQPSSVEFLEDPSLKLSLQDVKAMDGQFRPWTATDAGTAPSFGFTPSAYWLKLTLQREAGVGSDWLLEIPYAKLDLVDFYPSNGDPVLTGGSRDLATRPVFSRFFVFPISVGTEPTQVYLRVTSRYAVTVPMTLWTPEEFRRDEQLTELPQFMYFGGLAILTLFGLILFVILRETQFLLYGLYTLVLGLGIFAGNGFGRLVLWPSSPAFDEISQSGFLCLAAIFSTKFAREILAIPGKTQWLLVGIRGCQWLFGLILILIGLQFALQQGFPYGNQLLLVNSLIMACLVSWASFRAYLRQQPGIRYFFWSWAFLWFGVMVAALRAFGLLPSNVLTLYAVQIATTFETLLLAMALADRLRLDVLVRRQAQQDALAAKEQVLELTQNSEARLKGAVLSRTKELEAALATETLLREQYVRFGGMVAHEFRTPLSIIQTQMSVMRKEIACGIDQMAERSQAIQSATDRLALMFDRWLDSSATLNASFTLSPKPEILEQWLQTQLPNLSHLTSNHKLDVRLNGSRASAMVDDDHLGLVISNLIDNACKYSPAGTRVTLEVVNKPDFVGISVKDEGQGIAAEFHDKVFAEFSRLTMVEQIPGVGLGLAIVQRIVLAHGGHITLESSPGHGATFCIWLQSLTSAGQE